MTDMLVWSGSAPAQAAAPRPHAIYWVDEFDGYLTCIGVVDVTHDVKSFSFEVPGPVWLRFLPGQYLTLRLLVGGQRVERCYTISSSPTRPDRLTITVKRVPDGVVSNWLHDHLQVGDILGASGPFGRFSNALHASDKYLFLTAGSGITPAMSMLRAMRDASDPADVVFVHSARTPDDIIFRDELEALAVEAGVEIAILCEGDSASEEWAGLRGRLTMQALFEVAPDVLSREVFTCGPGPYLEAVRDLLVRLGADPARAHEESFTVGAGPASPDTEVEPTGTTFQVSFRRSGQVVECDSATTILEAAARAGVQLPSSCGEGMCGTCKLTMLSGAVDMQHAGGIRPREIQQDKILTCCSTPTADVALDA